MDKKSLQNKIGKRIKTLREQKNISQVDLAYACNFEKSNMSRIEAGNTCPNIYTLYKIAQYLEVDLADLLKFSENE
ncbi:MAG: helix-turn-helix transcriptional regulator [Flavobacteriaceae bacterium]|nr:helix-turn-helix transcriptional regulator [Flavobacteriaceae bacterium]